VKRGHPGALGLLGVGDTARVHIDSVQLSPRRVELGGALAFSFHVQSAAREPQALMIDYVVHFVKANGVASPKVFKLKRLTLGPAERLALSGKVSFAELTTRRHYPGRHRLELLINGVARPLAEFDVQG
jgi:hypothetical protein